MGNATGATQAEGGARPDEAISPARARKRDRDREETASAAITSLAAVATAWSAFQASTWSGVQTFGLAQSTRLRQQAVEARLEGDQLKHMDADLFVAYAGAIAEHKDEFASFLHDRFPPRLRKATDAWLATKPLQNASAPPHPFAMEEYVVEQQGRATVMNLEADGHMSAAATANRTSDIYVLGAVLFSTIILVASVGSRLRAATPRHAMLIASGAALLAVLAWMASRPVAWAGVSI